MMFNGMHVYTDASIPEFELKIVRERKWARRVMYQRNRRFDAKYERLAIVFNGALFCHPNTVAFIADAVAVFKTR